MFSAAIIVSRTVKQLIQYYPIVIPTLLVFYLESQKVRNAPEYRSKNTADCDWGPQESEMGILEEERKPVKQSALTMLAGVIILTLLIYADINLEPFQRRIIHSCVLFVPFLMITMFTLQVKFLEAQFAFRYSLFGAGSALGLNLDNIRLGAFAVSVPMIICAFFLDNSAAVLLTYLSMSQCLATICQRRMYPVTFKVYFCVAVATVVLLVLIFISPAILQGRIYSDADSIKWGCLLLSALILLLPFKILCMLLHFEGHITSPPVTFHLHINEIIFAFAQYQLESIPPPYWAMAFCVFGASLIVSAAISASGIMTFKMEEVGFFTALIATPSMIGISLLLAAMKGRLQDLWEYEEDWGIGKKRVDFILCAAPQIEDDATYPYILSESHDSDAA